MLDELFVQLLQYQWPLISHGQRQLCPGYRRPGLLQVIGHDGQAPAVDILGERNDTCDQRPELRAYSLGQADRHLRDVDPEGGVCPGRDIERNPRQLGVLVEGPQTVPSAGLDQPITTVDVQPLLSIPAAGTSRGLVRLGTREVVLGGQDERLDDDLMPDTGVVKGEPLGG